MNLTAEIKKKNCYWNCNAWERVNTFNETRVIGCLELELYGVVSCEDCDRFKPLDNLEFFVDLGKEKEHESISR